MLLSGVSLTATLNTESGLLALVSSTMQLLTNVYLSERYLSVTKSRVSSLRRHVATESRLSALPD